MKRQLTLPLAAITALIIGLYAGMQLTPPSDNNGVALPPSDLLATVEFRELADDVVVRGTAIRSRVVTIPTPDIRRDRADEVAVVTWALIRGDIVRDGSVILEVLERPLIALHGEVPLSREILLGDEGNDVAQIQVALSRLELDPGPIDGIYGESTQAALEALYEHLGYSALEPTRDEQRELEDADQHRIAALAAEKEAKDELTAVIAERVGRGGRPSLYPTEFFGTVAEVYREALDRGASVVEAVSTSEKLRDPKDPSKPATPVSANTAKKWISRARRFGFIPAAKPRSTKETPSGEVS